MSGEQEHGEPPGTPGQQTEVSAAPSLWGGVVRRVLAIGVGFALGSGVLLGGLVLHDFFRYYFDDCCSKESVARLGIAKIDEVVVAYKKTHGDYPPSLEVLTVPENGETPALEDKDLNDPWGNSFRYDPSDRHPTTGRPKIFTTSPKGREVSNW
jgi:hypothetical protein